jgi:hypothetical protein
LVINLDGEPLVELKMPHVTPTAEAILATAGNCNHLTAISGCQHRRENAQAIKKDPVL